MEGHLSEEILVGLAAIIILGILAQWLAWRLHLPAILLLLIFGFIAGPVTNVLDPDQVFGELLFPLVSVSVAIILFEGGLSLKIDELRRVGRAVRNLTTIGVLVTWVLSAAGAYFIVGIALEASVLLGAVLVVSGPTVIIPLLRQVRPKGNVGSIVKWEGIVNDPIGAILAVLVFEVILSGSAGEGTLAVIIGAIKAAIFGGLFGILGAATLVILLRRYLVPDFLQNPVSLMVVVIVFVAANGIQTEAGLLAVTIMGVALANQHFVSIKHIYEFKENLRVLLISSLFIILAARLPVAEIWLANPLTWVFVAFLIIIVRPTMVFASMFGTKCNFRERLFLSWMAPRGIVAAAVISVFAIQLADSGISDAGLLVPLTFQVIIGTVAVYGLTAPYAARKLKVASKAPQGVLFAGAQPWVQEIGVMLQKEGFNVVLVDSNWFNIKMARGKGLRSYYSDILSENLMADLDLDGIGRLLAMTPNDEVNSLAALHFEDVFDKQEVYQLPPQGRKDSAQKKKEMPKHLRGRFLFDRKASYQYLTTRFFSGAIVKRTPITEEFDMESLNSMYNYSVLPMFVIKESGNLEVIAAEDEFEPKAGQILISVVDPTEKDKRTTKTKKQVEDPDNSSKVS
jgi:NhaP-type Na+/H+ or K+/H+ antiporter